MIRQILARPGDTVRFPQTDYGQCTHAVLYRDGFNPTVKRGPAQNFICSLCRKQFTAGADRLVDKYVRIGRALRKPGATIRGVARQTGCSRVTVRKMRAKLADWRPNEK